MRSPASPAWLAAIAATILPVYAQTFTTCNPLQQTCPADPALGKSTTIDFTSGQSDQFKVSGGGQPTYDSEGAKFSVAKSGDSPTLTSDWYLMFGHVEVVMKAAPGVGIVSTLVLQSDCLDEIDYEWLGGDNAQVQSNYFGKGQTTTYNRGAFHPNPGNHDGFHTYTVDWTSEQIVWQIDGTTVRALPYAQAAEGQYPQTPMQIKLGVWSGGDPSNPPGTVQWAGGSTDYSAGPYTMIVKSIKATDYSSGTSYTYGDSSGTWKSIKSSGGSISGTGSAAGSPDMSSEAASAPSVTDPATGNPLPFDGTHRDTSSTYVRPSVWPWVPSESATTLSTGVATSIPGLPSGWTVSDTGKVVPPSAASATYQHTSPTGSSAASSQGYPSAPAPGSEPVITSAPVLPSAATTLATYAYAGTNENGSNPSGTKPNGSNPSGTKPNGSNPSGTAPNGSNPSGFVGRQTNETDTPDEPSIATGGAPGLSVATSFSLLCGSLLGAILL